MNVKAKGRFLLQEIALHLSDFSKIRFGNLITTSSSRISSQARARFPVLFRYHIRRKSFLGSILASGFPNALSPVAGVSRLCRFRFLLLEDFSSVSFDNKSETLEYRALPNLL